LNIEFDSIFNVQHKKFTSVFKNPFQVAISFAVIALIIKLIIFTLEVQHGAMETYIRYIYMLVLLTAVFFGIRSNKIIEGTKTSFGQDFKAGARTAAFFALLVAGITYIYYAKIDVNFFPIMKSELISEYADMLPELVAEKGIEEAKDITKNNIIGLNTIFSPYSQATYTLFGLVFMGIFNAVVFAFVMKKMPGFK